MSWLIRLLTLIALALMPLGMSAVLAQAQSHAGTGAAMPADHCPDMPASPPAHSDMGDCTMACAAALPALAPRANQRLALLDPPAPPVLAELRTGLHPETATPPPRFS